MNTGIAIVGMACRYADATSPDELWETVLARRRAFRAIPPERLQLADYAERRPNDPDSIYSIEAAVLKDYVFDRSHFRVPAATFAVTDLTHWLALSVASEALADAGLTAGAPYRDRTGVIIGNTLTGEFSRASILRLRWPYVRRQLEAALINEAFEADRREAFLRRLEEAFKSPFPVPNEESLSGGLSNTIAGRIANHFHLRGGAFTVDGACASSLLAVASACLRLTSGEVDVVLTGGVDLSLDPFELVGFSRIGALSKSIMRVFDARSDGFWPGEGCGFVVLMRESDAQQAGYSVRAVIRGWGVSTDGEGGLTRPTITGQSAALERAYALAGFDAGTVPLFEAHGTGTAVGDEIELAAIAATRRAANARHTAIVGSIKANIGHTKAAAGVAGLIKAALAIDKQVLPAATACDEPHPIVLQHNDFISVPAESRIWPADWPLRAGVSAMGFGGINVHVALEGTAAFRRSVLDAHEQRLVAAVWDAELFVFAADDRPTLHSQVAQFAELAPLLSRAELADAAAALAGQLKTGQERAMVVASSPAQLAQRLKQLLDRLKEGSGPVIDTANGLALGHGVEPRILFLFSGQAAPSYSSGGLWRRAFPEVALLYDTADLPAAGDEKATEVAQPAIVTASLSGLALLEALKIVGTGAIGHSLGELTALHWAGAYDATSLIRLARERGNAMAAHALPGGKMLLVNATPEVTQSIIGNERATIACYNGSQETVIAGFEQDIAKIRAQARANGIGAQVLPVSHAFHSHFLEPVVPVMERLVAGETIAPLRRPIFSTVTGGRLAADADIKALLAAQVVSPVRFAEAFAKAAQGADLIMEVGPGQGLARIASNFGGAPVIALDAGGASLTGILLAAGASFVLGAPVQVYRFFDRRFVRPFDLNRRFQFLAGPCEQAPTAVELRPRQVEPRAANHLPEPPPEHRSPFEVLRAVLARRLELPLDAIEPRHRLLSDLHLNSITVGQIVGEAARALGMPPPPVPTNFATATVGEAAEALSIGALSPNAKSDHFPAGVDTWVRVLLPQLIERPLAPRDDFPALTWQVFTPANHPLMPLFQQLSERPGGAGKAIAICLPKDPDEQHLPLLVSGARAAIECGDETLVLLVQQGGGGAAFARCLAAENPRLRVRVIDLPFGHKDVATWLAAEASEAAQGYGEAHYDRLGIRAVPLLRLRPGPDKVGGPSLLGPEDVILVSGGAKGIGNECALALARRTGASLALIGRSAVDEPDVAASLARLRAVGVIVAYERADVTNSASVAVALARLSGRLGPVTALIHAAGINEPTPIVSLDHAKASKTVAVKVSGARNLLAALDPGQLRLFVGFSSIIARIGLPGEAHYALANEWLGRLIEDFGRTHSSCRCLALEWSVWSGLGMGEKLASIEGLARQGVMAMPVDRATAVFEALFEGPSESVTMVVTSRFGEPKTVGLIRPPLPTGRFLERCSVFYPGIELIAEADLALASDPYLADHALGGTPLFPAVLGIEAMVQSASALSGGRPVRTLEAVEFRRPVTVGSDGAKLRVASLYRSGEHIELALRCDETGFQTDHFRAVARFDTISDFGFSGNSAAAPLHLDPGVLYKHLLFHTGRFARISDYMKLCATSCVARIAPAKANRWFPVREADDLQLGDPGTRDAALHALQACIPHRRVLPVAVGRIHLGVLAPDREYVVYGTETERAGDRITFDIDICDAAGRLAERWEGLTLQQIESLTPPQCWPVPLVAPYLERRLDEFLPKQSIRVRLENDTQGGGAPSSQAVIETMLPRGQSMHRRPDGKPESECKVSASHAGTLTLAVAAPLAVGCDIQTLEYSTEATWRDLLGADLFALTQFTAGEAREDFACAATRIWAAAESLKKAGATVAQAPLTLERVEPSWAIFSAGRFSVFTWLGSIACADSNPRIIAIAAATHQPSIAAIQPSPRSHQSLPSTPAGNQKGPAYSYRHIVGFGDTNLVGNVYFVNHLEWQGRCREMFLREKAPLIIDDLSRGLALVTTRCSCEYFNELNAFDEVRVDMRLKGMASNRIELSFEYWRCGNGTEELAAFGVQEVACFRAGESGKVPTAVPPSLHAALLPYGAGAMSGAEAG